MNHIGELVSHRRNQHHASPNPVEDERAIEIYAPLLLGDRGGGAVEFQSIQPQNPPKPKT
jgi:hypothetical protein